MGHYSREAKLECQLKRAKRRLLRARPGTPIVRTRAARHVPKLSCGPTGRCVAHLERTQSANSYVI